MTHVNKINFQAFNKPEDENKNEVLTHSDKNPKTQYLKDTKRG